MRETDGRDVTIDKTKLELLKWNIARHLRLLAFKINPPSNTKRTWLWHKLYVLIFLFDAPTKML